MIRKRVRKKNDLVCLQNWETKYFNYLEKSIHTARVDNTLHFTRSIPVQYRVAHPVVLPYLETGLRDLWVPGSNTWIQYLGTVHGTQVAIATG